MTLADLDLRVLGVEKRLLVVEKLLNLGPALPLEAHPSDACIAAQDLPRPLPLPPVDAQAPHRPPATLNPPRAPEFPPGGAPMASPVSPPIAPPVHPSLQPPPMPATPVTPIARKAEILHYPRLEKAPPVAQSDFEKTVGLKWAGWIGALVFVIGAALGVKYAYDQGWFNNLIPNWVWLTLIASAGFALIAAGEYVYRKINPLSAAGLFAAGVATLFVASYSGHAYYEIYSQSVAFTMMALSAVIGAAVAIRGNMVSIGVISLLGANIAPLLLGNRNAPIASFLMYLLATQIVALVLAARGRGEKWWTLRGLSLGTLTFWMIWVINTHAREHTTTIFTLIFAGIYQLELIITNWRDDRLSQSRRRGAAGLAFSMFVTAALTCAMLLISVDESNLVRTAWVLGIAAVCGGLGLLLSSQSRPALSDLSTGYALQAIALTFIAVPVYSSGATVEIGWMLLALALAVIGAFSEKGIPRSIAMIAWAAAVGHLLIRNGSETTHAVLFNVGDVQLHSNGAMAFSLALVGQLIAILTNTRQEKLSLRDASAMLSIAASIVFVITSLIELPMSTATFAVILFAWMLIGIAKWLPKQTGTTQGAVMLIAAAGKWLVFDALAPLFDSGAAQMPVILNTMNLSALILIASAVFLLVMTPSVVKTPRAIHDLRIALRLVIAVIALVDLSIEINRWFDQSGSAFLNDPRLAKQVALSIFWACFAVASVGVGFRIREASLRYFGLILLAITLLKIVTVDLSGISQGYRILSFIGVGLLMLGTSVLYGKVSPKLLAQGAGNSDDAEDR